MSKSYGNTIMLTDPEPVVRQKLKTMVTDPARVRRTDPGNPDVCPVGDLHKIFSDPETMDKVNIGCRSAGIGCIECKGWAADALAQILNPMQQRRKKYEDNPQLAWDILEAGRKPRAGRGFRATMEEVRDAMGMSLEYEAPKSDGEEARVSEMDRRSKNRSRGNRERAEQPRQLPAAALVAAKRRRKRLPFLRQRGRRL